MTIFWYEILIFQESKCEQGRGRNYERNQEKKTTRIRGINNWMTLMFWAVTLFTIYRRFLKYTLIWNVYYDQAMKIIKMHREINGHIKQSFLVFK